MKTFKKTYQQTSVVLIYADFSRCFYLNKNKSSHLESSYLNEKYTKQDNLQHISVV